VTGVVGFLALLEGEFDTANDADVFIHRDADGEDVLLRLAFMELFDANLKFGELVER